MKKSILLSSVALCLGGAPNAAFAEGLVAPADGAVDSASAADDASSDQAPEIIVTARRRAEEVSKVPIAITAFSGEQLQTRGFTSTLDIAKLAPGLNISGGGTLANPFIVLRGQSKAVTGTGAPGVLTYFNDVPLPNYGSLIQTYDMANVQVVKGPQGTLYGRNSIGGALLTNSQLPTYDFEGYVSGDVASYSFMQAEGALNVPIIAEKVAVRVAAQVGYEGGATKTIRFSPYTIDPTKIGTAGFVTPGQFVPSTRNTDEIRRQSFRATLLLEPTDWLRNVTVYDYSHIRGLQSSITQQFASFNNGPTVLYQLPPAFIQGIIAPPGSPPQQVGFANLYANAVIPALAQCATNQIQCNFNVAAAALRASNGARIQYVQQDPWLARTIVKGITNTTSVSFGNHTLKNIFGYRTTDSFSNTSLSGLPLQVINTASQTRLQQITEELQLSGSFFDNDLKYTVGGFYYVEKPNGLGGYQALEVNAFFGLSHSLATTYLKNTSKAIYGQFDYSLDKLIPGLSFTAGVRQTWDAQSACTTNQTVNPFGPAMLIVSADNQAGIVPSEDACRANTAGAGIVSQILPEAKFNKLTYTLALNWQVSPKTLIYATTRRGYRAGGYNTPIFDPYLASAQTYQPETLTDYEIGVKSRWQAGGIRGTIELAAFTGKDTGNQLPISTSNLTGGVCIPEALGSGGRTVANCSVAGAPGILVRHNTQTTTDNAGEITLRGFEFSGSITPTSGLTFGGSVAYVDTRVDKISLNPVISNLLRRAGRFAPTTIVIQGQPAWTANANIMADYPGKVLGGDLSVILDYRHSDSYQQVEVRLPARDQFDARVRLADIGNSGLTASVYLLNVTNSKLVNGGGATSPSGIGASSYIFSAPRTVGIQLLYKFGQ